MSKSSWPGFPRAFHRLAFSTLFAQSAEQIGLAATSIVAVLVLGTGASGAALLQATLTLPFLLFALPLGVLADRRSRSRLMATGEVVRFASLSAIFVLLVFGKLTMPLLALIGFLGAIGTVAYTVTAPSLVPSLVDRTRLLAANGRIELIRSLAYAGGPAIAGLLVGWTGARWAFGVAIIFSATAAVALRGIPDRRQITRSSRRPLDDIRQGIQFLWTNTLLRPILLTAVLFNLAWFCLQGIYVSYAISELGHSSTQVGIVLGSYGAGMLLGALLAPIVTTALPFGRVILIGPLSGATAAIVMLGTLWSPFIGIPMATYLLLGAGPILWTISTTTLRQAITPDDLLGRVSAVLTMSTAGARPLGAGIGALIAIAGGPQWCLVVACAGFLAQAFVIASSETIRIDEQPSMVESRVI
ncbi:MAG TPA: MFS transporter [Thermomicrobiales bacterium]|nr:MFS transporter [Thermomicrobiales bacterium]